MIPVISSNIHSVGYDSPTKLMHIQFHGGGLCAYSGVPQSIHSSLLNASSKGTYFHHHVKDRFPAIKLI